MDAKKLPWSGDGSQSYEYFAIGGDGIAEKDGKMSPSRLHDENRPATTSSAKASAKSAVETPESDLGTDAPFTPPEPKTLREAGLDDNQVESLILKYLWSYGESTGREIAAHCALPFQAIEGLLHLLKGERFVVFKGSVEMGDYVYSLTDAGADRAMRHSKKCAYVGAAPVPLEAYVASVEAQSVRRWHPTVEQTETAFADLVLGKPTLAQLAEAINGGRGFFLYGAPGNGKTSIAERVTDAFGDAIWIPRAVAVGGEIIRFFDDIKHTEAHEEATGLVNERKTDRRWVRIRRPTIVAGGELTMQNLEVTKNPITGVNEAPLQAKSNGGTLGQTRRV